MLLLLLLRLLLHQLLLGHCQLHSLPCSDGCRTGSCNLLLISYLLLLWSVVAAARLRRLWHLVRSSGLMRRQVRKLPHSPCVRLVKGTGA